MKKFLALFLVFILMFVNVSSLVLAEEDGDIELQLAPTDDITSNSDSIEYPSLIFSPEATIQNGGVPYTATVNANGVISGTLEFISYRVPAYAATPNPVVNANVYGMNIKVPVSWTPTGGDKVVFDPAVVAESPMLFHTPWGMDAQSLVLAANTIGAAGGVNSLKYLALSEGWVLVEAGMRGTGTYTGTIGQPSFMHYGKLPEPIVDQKAAIRYLRYETNADLIPGDKDRIFVTGFSSGGCSGSIIGSSGNHPMFDPYLERIGAAPTADNVYGVIIGCPIITREWSDSSHFWMRWGAYLDNPTVPAYSQLVLDFYDNYQKSLNIYAMVDGESKFLNDYETYGDYMVQYYKKSIIDFLNRISTHGTNMALGSGTYGNFVGFPTGGTHQTGRAAIDLYLSTRASTTVPIRGTWIIPIYDPDDPGKVIDLDLTYDQVLRNYIATSGSVNTAPRPFTDNAYWYPRNLTNGALMSNVSGASSATTQSMGGPTHFGAAFSDIGWYAIENELLPSTANAGTGYGFAISQDYKDLLNMQKNSVNPTYFTHGEGKADSDTAPYWFIRNGSNDPACIMPLMFNLAESLKMRGLYADVGINWDRGHEFVSDVVQAWEFAKQAAAGELSQEPTLYPPEFPSLVFKPEAMLQNGGVPYSATVNANGVISGTVEFITYRIPAYAATPNPNVAATVYGMNIKVPVSWTPTGGEKVVFDPEEVANAPMLFHTPWGGDAQANVAAVNTIGAAGGVNSLKYLALSEGWVLVESGMRGNGTHTGTATIGTPAFEHYGKLPNPIVDQKAALRYLRYYTNADLIPGDKDRIFVTGSSSGGCSGSILGSSGNNPLFAPYLEGIGAAPTSDAVYGVIIGCPIITREWSDSAHFWMRWGARLGDPTVASYSHLVLSMYDDYQKSLGIYAMVDGVSRYLDNYHTYGDYMVQYAKKSIIDFLNQISAHGTNMALLNGQYGNFVGFPTGGTHQTGRAAIDLYLSTRASTTVPLRGAWINPIYDPDDPGKVIDLDLTYEQFRTNYVVTSGNVNTAPRPFTDNAFWYPRSLTADGALIGNVSGASSATTTSMGRSSDFGVAFSDIGWYVLENELLPSTANAGTGYGITVPQEMRDLVNMQKNVVNPTYFTHGAGRAGSEAAGYWYIRNGSNDPACILPLMFNLAESLRMRGIYVDVGINWDRGHEFVSDVLQAWEFAKLAADGQLSYEATPLPGVRSLRITDANGAPLPALFTVARGSTIDLGLELNYGASDEGVIWTINNPALATVDAKGKVTVKTTVGTVILTARDVESGVTQVITLRII